MGVIQEAYLKRIKCTCTYHDIHRKNVTAFVVNSGVVPVVQEITKIRCIDIKFVRSGLSHYSDDQTKVFFETVKE
jgi:hypothetical protein